MLAPSACRAEIATRLMGGSRLEFVAWHVGTITSLNDKPDRCLRCGIGGLFPMVRATMDLGNTIYEALVLLLDKQWSCFTRLYTENERFFDPMNRRLTVNPNGISQSRPPKKKSQGAYLYK